MTTSAERAEEGSSRLDPVQAVGRFFREDPARILAVASILRAPDRAVESTVVGMSMGRTIPAGSRIRIKLVEQRQYARGEVVAFVAGDHVVVHRIVRRARRGTRGFLLTRGDAALLPDPPVDEDRILGPVTAVRHEDVWAAPAPAPRPTSVPARLVASAVLLAVMGLLRLNPRVAAVFVAVLHRSARPFRGAGSTPPRPSAPRRSAA